MFCIKNWTKSIRNYKKCSTEKMFLGMSSMCLINFRTSRQVWIWFYAKKAQTGQKIQKNIFKSKMVISMYRLPCIA